jgi:hypothetical protein
MGGPQKGAGAIGGAHMGGLHAGAKAGGGANNPPMTAAGSPITVPQMPEHMPRTPPQSPKGDGGRQTGGAL